VGRTDLPPPVGLGGVDPIGENWFQDKGAPLDLLIKYLFTSEELSMQVDHSDELAAAKGMPSGKEECWLVLDAEPDAIRGIGTREPLDAERLRAAALDGSFEALIDWKPVSRGDFYYVPARNDGVYQRYNNLRHRGLGSRGDRTESFHSGICRSALESALSTYWKFELT